MLSTAGARIGSTGHGGTSDVKIVFRVLIQSTPVFARKERTDVFRNVSKMSDRIKPPHCVMRVAFLPGPHT